MEEKGLPIEISICRKDSTAASPSTGAGWRFSHLSSGATQICAHSSPSTSAAGTTACCQGASELPPPAANQTPPSRTDTAAQIQHSG